MIMVLNVLTKGLLTEPKVPSAGTLPEMTYATSRHGSPQALHICTLPWSLDSILVLVIFLLQLNRLPYRLPPFNILHCRLSLHPNPHPPPLSPLPF